jgi:YidC/Oxa1 family membrane protein insertase
MKINTIMTPEIQAIQKKYQNRKDQQSQLQQQEEIKAVYDKYGTSPTGSCLQLIIQMPILLAVYRVVVGINPNNAQGYKCFVPSITKLSETAQNAANKFFCYDLSTAPKDMDLNIILVWLIPILAGLFQFLSVQISQKLNKQPGQGDNPMAGSMKMMNYMMPLISIWMCYQFASGIGIYWVVGSLVMMFQQIFINIHMKKVNVDDIIEANRGKAEKKAAKRKAKQGIYREKVIEASQVNTKSVSGNSSISAAEKEEKLRKAKEIAANKSDSLAAKANMVSKLNNNKDK